MANIKLNDRHPSPRKRTFRGRLQASLVAGTEATAAVMVMLAPAMLLAGGMAAHHAANPSGGAFEIAVPGIPGPYCAYGAEKRLLEVPGVARVEMRWQAERIVVTLAPGAHVTMPDLRRAVERSEYPYPYDIVAGR